MQNHTFRDSLQNEVKNLRQIILQNSDRSDLTDELEAELRVLNTFDEVILKGTYDKEKDEKGDAAKPAKALSIPEKMIYKDMSELEAERCLRQGKGSFLVREPKDWKNYLVYPDLQKADMSKLKVVSYFDTNTNKFVHKPFILEKNGKYRLAGTKILQYTDAELADVALSAAHFRSGVSDKPIPEPPAGINISQLSAIIKTPGIRKHIPGNEKEKDEFITKFTEKVEAFKRGGVIIDGIGEQFPSEYIVSAKKVLGWITKRFSERFAEIEKMKKGAETDVEAQAKIAKELEQIELDFAYIIQDLAEGLFYCYERTSSELSIIYRDLGLESAEDATQAYEAGSLPNKIALLAGKLRIAHYRDMIRSHKHVPTNLQPEYEQHYQNVFQKEFGLGFDEFAKVQTKLRREHVNPGYIEMFRQDFNQLHNAKTFTAYITDQINQKIIPRDLVLEWFSNNYPDIEASDLMLDNKRFNPKAIAVMLRDLGMSDWPQLNPTAEQSLAKVRSYAEQVAKCTNLDELCNLSYQVLNEGRRLLMKERPESESEVKYRAAFDKEHAELLGAIDKRANELYIAFDKRLLEIQAQSGTVEHDLALLNNAINEISFINEEHFRDRNLQPQKDSPDYFKNLRMFITGLRFRIEPLLEKKFLLNLKVINEKLTSKNLEELEKSINFGEALVRKLESKDKIADLTDVERKRFVETIRESLGNARIRLEDMQKAKAAEDQAKEATAQKDYASIYNKRHAEWDEKIKAKFSSVEEWKKLETEMTSNDSWNLVRRAGVERKHQALLKSLREAKPAK